MYDDVTYVYDDVTIWQVGYLTQAASYNGPRLTEVAPATLHAESAANQERGLLLTLTGVSFGTTDSSLQVCVCVCVCVCVYVCARDQGSFDTYSFLWNPMPKPYA